MDPNTFHQTDVQRESESLDLRERHPHNEDAVGLAQDDCLANGAYFHQKVK